jgi:DNA polymerase-3 subunit beta
MNINFSLKDLQNALKTVKYAIRSKTSIDLLQGTMFEVNDENSVKIKATDRSLGIECEVGATVEDADDILNTPDSRFVLPKDFVTLANSLKGDEIEIDYDSEDKVAEVSCSGNHFTFNCDSAINYPVFPDREDDWQFEISQKLLKDSLKRVSVAAANDKDGTQILNGVLFEVTEDTISLAATDRFKLAKETLMEVTSPLDEVDEVIPNELIKVLLKELANDSEETVSICFEEDKMYFEIDNDMTVKIHSSKLHGDFPSISQIIPTSSNHELTVNRKDMIDNLKILKPLTSEFIIRMDLNTSKEKLYFTAQGTEAGAGYTSIPVEEFDGESTHLTFEGDSVLKGLKSLDSEKIIFKLTNSESQALMNMNQNDNYDFVFMPLRTDIEPEEEVLEVIETEEEEVLEKETEESAEEVVVAEEVTEENAEIEDVA